MRSLDDIKAQLEKEYGLYRVTNDAQVLQNECYQRIKVLEWVIEQREAI